MQQTLILGGYDAAWLDGTFDTFPLEPSTDRHSYLHVEVADILVRPSRGAAPVSLIADKSPFNISIDNDPAGPLLLLPQDLTTAYLKRTSAEVIAASQIPELEFLDTLTPDLSLLHHSSHFSGDLTVVLSSGLRATIPNKYLVANATTKTNGTVQLSSMLASYPSLGLLWLAGIVVAVDYEQGRSGLAMSNSNTTEVPRLQPKERKPMALGCDGGHLLEGKGKGNDSAGLPAKAIAGIVCGAVGALLLLVLVLWRLKPCWAGKATPPPTVSTTEIVRNEVVGAPQAESEGSFVEMGLGDERPHSELAG